VRCPQCNTDNPEGAALCAGCAAPLTAYAGAVSADVNSERLAQLERLRVRPPAVLALVGYDVLVLTLGPVRAVMESLRAQPALSPDQTNYIGHAFGAVSTALLSLVMLPVAIGLLLAAYWAWTERSAGWWASMAVAALVGSGALLGVGVPGPLRLPALAAGAAVLIAGFTPRLREWYGIQ